MITLLLGLLAAAPADTTRYLVLNHGRPRGECWSSTPHTPFEASWDERLF